MVVALHLTAFQNTVDAAPFGSLNCSSCPNYQFVRYQYESRDPNEVRPNPYAGREEYWPNWFHASWDYPAGVGRGEHYGSAIRDLDHLVYANRYVEEVRFYFDRFDLVSGLDYLSISHPAAPVANYTGHQPAGSFLSHVAHRDEQVLGTSFPFSFFPIRMRFNSLSLHERGFSEGIYPPHYPPWSDVRNFTTDDGFNVALTALCCGQQSFPWEPYLVPTMRNQVLLLGAGDTLFFQYPNDRADTDHIVAIWDNDVAADARYDIYARCNAPPTHDTWDFSTWQPTSPAGAKQAVLLLSEMCTVPGTWYLAVHQETGQETGTVNLVVTTHFENRRRHVDVGFDCTADPECDLQQARNTVQKAARFFYGATEGAHVIRSVQVHETSNCGDCGGQTCDLCWTDAPGNSHCCSGGYSTITKQFWDAPSGVAHEWGHQYLGADDEYIDDVYLCGHSIMAAQWLTNNLCIPTDHVRDTAPGAYPIQPGPGSVWPHGSSPVEITTTPDSYDYLDHPLGGYVGAIVPSGGGGSCRAVLGPLPSVGHLLIWLTTLALCAVQARKRRRPVRRAAAGRSVSSKEQH